MDVYRYNYVYLSVYICVCIYDYNNGDYFTIKNEWRGALNGALLFE